MEATPLYLQCSRSMVDLGDLLLGLYRVITEVDFFILRVDVRLWTS
jgi:hypothetical protein